MPEALNTFNNRDVVYRYPPIEGSMGSGKSLRETMGRDHVDGTVFQFQCNLDALMGDVNITQVTDELRVVGVNKDRKTIIYFDGKSEVLDEGHHVVCLNDKMTFILDSNESRDVFQRGEKLSLTKSPVMSSFPNFVNTDEIIGGCVRLRNLPYARIWDENGILLLEEKTPKTCIMKVCPRGSLYAIGYAGEDSACWIGGKMQILSGPNEATAYASHINSAGLIGGSYVSETGDPLAGAWNKNGQFVDLDLKLEGKRSNVCGLLEDGTFIVEAYVSDTDKEYFMGRPGDMRPFDSTSIQSEETSTLVSVEAVSPLGVLVVSVKYPGLDRVVPILISTESARRMVVE